MPDSIRDKSSVSLIMCSRCQPACWIWLAQTRWCSTNKLPQEYFAFLKETGGYPGRPWGEAASAWTKVTDQWSRSACARALEMLLEADIALKDTTVSNAEQTMMSLVLSLCALREKRKASRPNPHYA